MAIAQSLPYGQRVTYWPLRALLVRLVGLKEEAAPDAVREEIRAWLQDGGVESPERVADLLAATIGAGEPEVIDRPALFAAWRTAIEVAGRRAPLVLVFEDLHWASDSLLDLVEFIMQPRGDVAVLMIALTRPELLDRRPGWGGGRRNYVAVSLEPLSDDVGRAAGPPRGRRDAPRRSSSGSWPGPKATPSSRAKSSSRSGSASTR